MVRGYTALFRAHLGSADRHPFAGQCETAQPPLSSPHLCRHTMDVRLYVSPLTHVMFCTWCSCSVTIKETSTGRSGVAAPNINR